MSETISVSTIVVYNPRIQKIISQGGSNMFHMPHGLSIGPTGSFWATDLDLNQVMRLEPSWNKSRDFLRLGLIIKAFNGGNGKSHFCQPTHAVESPDGSLVFVSDGECNGRVVRFNAKSGAYMGSFGKESRRVAKPGTFLVPHFLILIESRDLICVAERLNNRIQCFTAGLQNNPEQFGLLQSNIKNPIFQNIFTVWFDNKDESLLALSSNWVAVSGTNWPVQNAVFRIDLATSTVTKRFEIQGGIQKAHNMAVDANGNGYISEVGLGRVWMLFRK